MAFISLSSRGLSPDRLGADRVSGPLLLASLDCSIKLGGTATWVVAGTQDPQVAWDCWGLVVAYPRRDPLSAMMNIRSASRQTRMIKPTTRYPSVSS